MNGARFSEKLKTRRNLFSGFRPLNSALLFFRPANAIAEWCGGRLDTPLASAGWPALRRPGTEGEQRRSGTGGGGGGGGAWSRSQIAGGGGWANLRPAVTGWVADGAVP